jgi:octaheme c-type cytochrome (tetrathionate reductase family)
MKRIVLILMTAALAIVVALAVLLPGGRDASQLEVLRAKYSRKEPRRVDHSLFSQLQRSFASPQDVTASCITCHNQRHTEVMQSNHWNWEREEYVEGRGVVYVGKKNAINNFCIGAMGNELSCAKCHIGFGVTEAGLRVTDATNIDCLICHDQTETYAKANNLGGAPDAKVDLAKVAQSVGRPNRSNCGVCHFYGGGGNNVKHGDLDMAMFEPDRALDVHMAVEGANMTCVDCHTTERHMIGGKLYSLSSMNRNRISCDQCHTETPHASSVLNEHSIKVACQTCHIPRYAKANATKTYWDWSTAGRLRDGQPYEEDDSAGNHTYLSIKGSFTWGRDLEPEYAWFNGTASHYLLGDKVHDTTEAIVLNTLHGSYADEESKIIPVKVHRARQPYDPGTGLLVLPKLHADREGEGGYWKDFNWQRAAEVGMQHAGQPFSGEVAFARTAMNWPVNHQVAPKEEALQCADCHTREGGRLAGLTDFYLPGRDNEPLVETLGAALLLLTLAGVLVHGSLRIVVTRRRRRTGGVA